LKISRVRLIKIISTVFYVGYMPLFPGTWGSLVGLLIYLFINQNIALYSVITIAAIGLGFLLYC